MKKNLVFVQDEEDAWYLIPEPIVPIFYQVLNEAMSSGEYADFILRFDEDKCDHPSYYTVDNPKRRTK